MSHERILLRDIYARIKRR